jgi:hypothetical protein
MKESVDGFLKILYIGLFSISLKEEALDRTQWKIRFGRGYGPVVRQTTE